MREVHEAADCPMVSKPHSLPVFGGTEEEARQPLPAAEMPRMTGEGMLYSEACPVSLTIIL